MKEEKLKKLLLENEELLIRTVQKINSWNGSLDHLEYFENDEEFFNMFFENKVIEAVRAVYYGNYNYNDDYVKFDGYGNLETCNYYDFIEELQENINEIIEIIIEEKDNLYLDEEIIEILER